MPSNHHITWLQKGKSKTKMKDTSIGELLDRQKLTPETNTILGAGSNWLNNNPRASATFRWVKLHLKCGCKLHFNWSSSPSRLEGHPATTSSVGPCQLLQNGLSERSICNSDTLRHWYIKMVHHNCLRFPTKETCGNLYFHQSSLEA